MFQDQTAVITGASSGLGQALAVELARQGANVVLFARNQAGLAATASRCRATAVCSVTGDVRDPDDCERLVREAVERFGSVDHLVLAAGVSMWARFDEVEDLTIFRKLIETNYLGAVYCTHHALPHLAQSGGLIVAVSSIQGRIGVPFHTGYVASKHAVQGFFEALRIELDGSGVDVLTVLPPWLRGTNLRRNAFGGDGAARGDDHRAHGKESIGRGACCSEVVAAMAARRRELVLPPKLRLLGLLRAISPRLVERIVKRKTERQP